MDANAEMVGCGVCKKFPAPSSAYEEIGMSISRHGTLYRCKHCQQFIELIEEERSARFIDDKEAGTHYPGPHNL